MWTERIDIFEEFSHEPYYTNCIIDIDWMKIKEKITTQILYSVNNFEQNYAGSGSALP